MKALRYLKRDKTFSWINIGGLAIGLTAVLYMALYIWQESNYDGFHHDVENLYRVSITYTRDGVELGGAPEFVDPLAPAMKAEIPEIEAATRIGARRTFNVQYDEKLLKVEHVFYADTAFLDMFNFPLLRGNPRTALTAPFSIVITERTANNLFGADDPIGKVVRVNGNNLYTVTGVFKTLPTNTQFKFNALASFSTLYHLPDIMMGWNGGNQYVALVRLHSQSSPATVNEKTNNIVWQHIGQHVAGFGFEYKASLQPIRNAHFYDRPQLRTMLSIFAVVAFLTLLVAGINFVNMTAARSLRRIKESGVRKLFGAKRWNLVKMFLGESLLVSLAAFALALYLFKILEPLYARLTGALESGTIFSGGIVIVGVFVLTVLIGIIAACYPAFRLSSLPLGDAAKGGGKYKTGKHRVQNALIVLQFTISVVLIVCTLVVSNQLSYMTNMDTGIDGDRIINLSLTGESAREREPLLKSLLENMPEVTAVSASSDVPAFGFGRNGYFPEGMENPMMINLLSTDENFIDVYGIKLKEGRFFNNSDTDLTTIVINESLVNTLRWGDAAIGKYIRRGERLEVIGVVYDFNYEPMYSKIEPLIIANRSNDANFRYISIKYNTSDVAGLISRIRDLWMEINHDSTFEYYFFDELSSSVYAMEKQFRALFFSFAFITIVLAVLGMFSLMAYTLEQRKKEIGIRKVMGASILDILRLLLRKTTIQVLVSNIIAAPVAWLLMNEYLKIYAYRIQIGWTIFALTLFISAFVALITLVFQTIRAAMENPLKVISSE